MSSQWVYIFGERSGADLKIGKTSAKRAAERLRAVNREQTTDESYVCLAAIRGAAKDETYLKAHFSRHNKRKGAKTEYFAPAPELVGYAAWLRSQWFASADGQDDQDGFYVPEPEAWTPDTGRYVPPPTRDPAKLIQDYEASGGPLAGTAWSWFPNPRASIQDYFTPSEIIDAARRAMGGIDLDAASHWLANRRHKIKKYFTASYSAFEHEWGGRVWLNPPYGDNARWWARVLEFVDSGAIEQICILSPVWAFNTNVAKPLIARSAAMVVLSPTPTFWGNSEGKEGTNQPHAIVYVGARKAAFLREMAPFGIPMAIETNSPTEKAAA